MCWGSDCARALKNKDVVVVVGSFLFKGAKQSSPRSTKQDGR